MISGEHAGAGSGTRGHMPRARSRPPLHISHITSPALPHAHGPCDCWEETTASVTEAQRDGVVWPESASWLLWKNSLKCPGVRLFPLQEKKKGRLLPLW